MKQNIQKGSIFLVVTLALLVAPVVPATAQVVAGATVDSTAWSPLAWIGDLADLWQVVEGWGTDVVKRGGEMDPNGAPADQSTTTAGADGSGAPLADGVS